MTEIRPIVEEVASLCPPVGKPISYGRVYVVRHPSAGIQLIFQSNETDVVGKPLIYGLVTWIKPAKAKLGGRIDIIEGRYLIIGGGKKAAKRVADALNAG